MQRSYAETIQSFYSWALNRKSTAYAYAGLALRLSVSLGLHRCLAADCDGSPVEAENRRRGKYFTLNARVLRLTVVNSVLDSVHVREDIQLQAWPSCSLEG